MKGLFVLAAASLLSLTASGCKESCDPAEFRGTAICHDDGRHVEMCLWQTDTGSEADWYLESVACPSYAPHCVDRKVGGVICKGEVIGECDVPGFVRCADIATMISCRIDENGRPYLSRGVCAPGTRCLTGVGDDHPQAFDPSYSEHSVARAAAYRDRGCYPNESDVLGSGPFP